MGLYDCLIVGHRGTGKTTTGYELAKLGWAVVDLDQKIEEVAGQTCSDLLASDPSKFRELETSTLHTLVNDGTETPRIVVCGAGAMVFPDEALVIWLRRENWHHAARDERERLRPEISFDEEVAWMKSSREPRWIERSDFVFDIPVGRSPTRVAQEISDVLRWAKVGGGLAQKTWLIATTSAPRLRFLVNALSLRGVETRSDLAADCPEDVPLLASLRTPDPAWLAGHATADGFDIDLQFLTSVFESRVLDELPPRPIILSVHPNEVTPTTKDALIAAKAEFVSRYPSWTHVETKCAGPGTVAAFQGREGVDTCLPTSTKLNWLRTLFAFTNTQNYLAPGVKPSRIDDSLSDSIPPMDLQDWAMNFGLDDLSIRAGLVGDPIQRSQGPWWHRKNAEIAGQSLVYLGIPVKLGGLQETLDHLQAYGVSRISVTSPLKIEAARLSESALPALNTLLFDGKWTGTDTDADGADAAFQEVRTRGLHSGSVLVVGTGGVAAAILRALDGSGFEPVTHLPGRHTGLWPQTDLVINASGHTPHNPPSPAVWLDLHYNGVEAIEAPVHLGGDTFFEGQARAQRRFWRLED